MTSGESLPRQRDINLMKSDLQEVQRDLQLLQGGASNQQSAFSQRLCPLAEG